MKVLKVEWISGRSTIGIILARNDAGETHVYIGSVLGYDPEDDVQYILEYGTKMKPEVFKARFEKFM